MSDYIGIDYSLGKANFDKDTGIHFGVISCNSVHPDVFDDFEAVYPEDCEENGDYEAIAYTYQENGYLIEYLESFNCYMILRSPYTTKCAYCSPCFPGAGDLDAYRVNGIETYCLGYEFFKDAIAPYTIEEVKL